MGSSPSREVFVNKANEMTATVIQKIALDCNSYANTTQTVSLSCKPTLSDPAVPYEANPVCKACIQNVVDARMSYYAFQESRLVETGGVAKPINEDYREIINAFVACGKSNCKACSIENVSQRSVVTQTTNCEAFNNVKNNVVQKLSVAIAQDLNNNQDFLSAIAGTLGAGTSAEVTENITNRMKTIITDELINRLQNQVEIDQTIEFNVGGVISNGMSQETAVSSIMNFLTENNIFNDIFTEDELDSIQQLHNDQNTLDTLGQLAADSIGIFANLTATVVGQITLFVMILTAAIVAGVIIYSIYKKLKQNKNVVQQEKDLIQRLNT